jgi:hypothetical protein
MHIDHNLSALRALDKNNIATTKSKKSESKTETSSYQALSSALKNNNNKKIAANTVATPTQANTHVQSMEETAAKVAQLQAKPPNS